MAGAVLVSKDVAVSMSGISFDLIVESTREVLTDSDQIDLAPAYWAHDHGGMDWVDLQELPEKAFNLFVAATQVARRDTAERHGIAFENVWGELVEALLRDPRFRAP